MSTGNVDHLASTRQTGRETRKVRFIAAGVMNTLAVQSDFRFRTNLSKPYMVLVEPTLRCPMACKFCDLPTDRTYPRQDELPIQRWMEILSELREFSPLIRSVYISGGEPFFRRDLIDLIEYAHEIGLGTRTLTVGQFCNEALLDRLLASPMEVLKFSLHSSQSDVHNALVGRDVFDRAVGAIRYLRSNGYQGRIGILCTAFAGNADHLADVARFATDLGVDEILFRPLFGQTVANREPELLLQEAEYNPECVVPDVSVLRRSVAELKAMRGSVSPIVDTDDQLDAIVGLADGTFRPPSGCHMMYEGIYIKPNGNIDACGHLALGVLGNVAERAGGGGLRSSEAYEVRHGVSRRCACDGNVFLNRTAAQRRALAIDVLRDRKRGGRS